MLISTVQTLLLRDLEKLKTEIVAYRDENKIWIKEYAIPNSAGNLCLHLVGNLNGFIGTVLGNTGYKRNRDLEFSSGAVARTVLVQMIDDTIQMITTVMPQLRDTDMEAEYPQQVFDKKTSTGYFLVHLAAHLSYHLGQINYHRRLLDH